MTKHLVVCIDTLITLPPLNFDYDLTEYPSTTPEDLPSRIKDATIVVTNTTPVTKKKNHLNRPEPPAHSVTAAKARNVIVSHVPAQSAASVSEHAFALYFALRRNILPLHALTLDGKTWAGDNMLHKHFAHPPRTNAEETLVVVGYGAIGKNVAAIGSALGMRVLVAERKGAGSVREGRTGFEECLKEGTVFVVVVPSSSDGSTKDMFARREFEVMNESAVIVNAGRGGAINESDLVEALKSKQIGGAATDVYENEPATKENCPLLDPMIPNLVLTPHIAWFSSSTIKNTVAMAKANLEAFAAGKPQNVVQ
ncbi:hypothetical protein PRZ48_006544 [Zasmidium cellare]|uniref:Glycerate dehydrogenase n=1 Tax=Zasmidium cellare TaxID=395010 RepID=A0ABR0END6_ZASCE|nr:hypothetical protein PRZ48_006544 [Zasmidium cellare]